MAHDAETIRFYTREAAIYAARQRQRPDTRLEAFFSLLPTAPLVLELGCGGGHDARLLIGMGAKVVATDASPEMARQAETRIGAPVAVMLAEDLAAVETFDGVWASASLLHIPRDRLAFVLYKVFRALKPGGVFYASYKAGEGAGRDALGRYYNYPSESWLLQTYAEAGAWHSVAVETPQGGGYDGQAALWLYVTTRKAEITEKSKTSAE